MTYSTFGVFITPHFPKIGAEVCMEHSITFNVEKIKNILEIRYLLTQFDSRVKPEDFMIISHVDFHKQNAVLEENCGLTLTKDLINQRVLLLVPC